MTTRHTVEELLNTHADHQACKEARAQRLDYFLALSAEERAAQWRMLSHESRRELVILAQLRKYNNYNESTVEACVAHWNARYGAEPTPLEAAAQEALTDSIRRMRQLADQATDAEEARYFAREAKAAERALAMLAAGIAPVQEADGAWRVKSATDATIYTLTRSGLCSCEAGQHGQPCKHAALVMAWEVAWERVSLDADDPEADDPDLVLELTPRHFGQRLAAARLAYVG